MMQDLLQKKVPDKIKSVLYGFVLADVSEVGLHTVGVHNSDIQEPNKNTFEIPSWDRKILLVALKQQ